LDILAGTAADQTELDKSKDARLAKLIDEGVDRLYDAPGKPLRVTKARIRGLLPIRLHYAIRARYPLAQERIDRYVESFWHFNLGRLLFAAAEVRRLQARPISTQLRKFSGIHSDVFLSQLEYFGWEPEELSMPYFDQKPTLLQAGVDHHWQWS